LEDPKRKNAKVFKKPPQPPKAKINERAIPRKYILTVLRDGYYEPMNEEEFEKWKVDNPEMAVYFENEEAINQLEIP
jgi:hypothetical protein